MVFATSKIIDRAPVVKFTFHGYGGRREGEYYVCIVGRDDPEGGQSVSSARILESLSIVSNLEKF